MILPLQMKKLFVVCALINVGSVFGQSDKKVFYSENGERIMSAAGSSYYRVGNFQIINHSPGGVDTLFVDSARTYYSLSGKLRSKEFYNERGSIHKDYVEYFENGRIREKGTYADGRRSRYRYGFYPSGKTQHVFFYAGAEPDFFQTNRRIFAYWDSLDNQLVKDGQGLCKCYFSPSRPNVREEGQVVSGVRSGEWSLYENNKLVNKETFEKGQFVSGIAFTSEGEFPYTTLETQVEFKGGLQALAQFISQVLKYPMDARRMGIEGQVFVAFVVEKDGSLSEVEIVKGISHTLDIEALRVIHASERKWNPGRQRGHPIRSKFVLPIRFKLEG